MFSAMLQFTRERPSKAMAYLALQACRRRPQSPCFRARVSPDPPPCQMETKSDYSAEAWINTHARNKKQSLPRRSPNDTICKSSSRGPEVHAVSHGQQPGSARFLCVTQDPIEKYLHKKRQLYASGQRSLPCPHESANGEGVPATRARSARKG